MRVINLTNNAVLADKVKLADTFLSRLVGLLNRKSLENGEALILKPATSIHTFFMRFTIDVIFLDKNGRIIGILPSIRPFRISPIYFKSKLVIELPNDTLKMTKTQLGDMTQII